MEITLHMLQRGFNFITITGTPFPVEVTHNSK